MTLLPDGPARGRPTGGTSLRRSLDKAWFLDLSVHIEAVLERAAKTDVLARPPAVLVVGTGAKAWSAWFVAHGAVPADEGRRADVVVCIDAYAGISPREIRHGFGALHAAAAPGARIVVVERVVRRRGAQAIELRDLLGQLGAATGTGVALHEVRSLARPGEPHRSTVLLELLRLGQPQETA